MLRFSLWLEWELTSLAHAAFSVTSDRSPLMTSFIPVHQSTELAFTSGLFPDEERALKLTCNRRAAAHADQR